MATQIIAPKFQLGEIVKLSSSVQKMTITWLQTRPKIGKPITDVFTGFFQCSWFDGLQLQKELFHQDALIKCLASNEDEKKAGGTFNKNIDSK